MIIRLPNYNIGPKIVSLAKDAETAEYFHTTGLCYMFLNNDSLIFGPDNTRLLLNEDSIEKLSSCVNYDIFQINDSGFAYRCYDNTSADNGLVLTGHCNSNCIMCPASDGQRQVDNADLHEILEIIEHIPSDALHLTLTGGEPFLIGEKIFTVLSCLKYRLPECKYLLLTNGRVLSNNYYLNRFIESVPDNTIIGIPLHGNDPSTHDSITRSPGGFLQTVHGIKNLLSNGFKVELRMVVSKLNVNNIPKIASFIADHFPDVFRVEIMGLEMLGNAALNYDKVWLPYREAFSGAKEAVDILVANGITVGLYNFPLCAVDKEYRLIAERSISDYKVRYPDACEQCTIKDACGGIFQGTLRFAQNDVQPVI